MRDELLNPLTFIMERCDILLAETALDFPQERMVGAIQGVCHEMYDLVISVPDLTWDKARELLSYEARSHLATVIGYAEELLDEADKLDESQQNAVADIHEAGVYLLEQLTHIEQ